MGELIIWLIIMVPVSALISGIGIYAMKRKKPMWFWSGSTVSEEEIRDIPSYNRANGIMWIVFSLIFWISTIAGIFNMSFAGVIMIVGSIIGTPFLVIAYNRIYKKYKA
ncbi:MAG: hypothetical protein K6E63_06545 [Lachnospiraceae bacterium]|nr:hypothetical protein [Lachnospiraceae bacterium]